MPPILQSDEVLVNRKSTSPTVNPFSTISASFGFCHVFSVTSSLCSRIQSRAPRCIGLLYFLCPLRSMTISQSFSIFMTVSILRNTSPISCRMSSNLGLSDVFFSFFMIWLRSWIWARKAQKWSALLVTSYEATHDIHKTSLVMLTFITWQRWYLPGFSTVHCYFYLSKLYSLEASD